MNKSYLEQALKTEKRINDELKQELELQKLINLDLKEENIDKTTKINNYKNVMKNIEKIIKEQNYNSVKNLENKIKSILTTAKSI